MNPGFLISARQGCTLEVAYIWIQIRSQICLVIAGEWVVIGKDKGKLTHIFLTLTEKVLLVKGGAVVSPFNGEFLVTFWAGNVRTVALLPKGFGGVKQVEPAGG